MTDPAERHQLVMNSGELYTDVGPGNEDLEAARERGKDLVYDYNLTRPSAVDERRNLLNQLFGRLGANAWIEPPLRVAYGSHTFIGTDFYANFNLVLVDDAEVHIGDHVLIGPNVSITTAGHPMQPEARRTVGQFSLPVTIGDDVWIGGHVIVLPGVTIGAGSVIAAGAVVSRDIPAGVLAAGVPCRVVRHVDSRDEPDARPSS